MSVMSEQRNSDASDTGWRLWLGRLRRRPSPSHATQHYELDPAVRTLRDAALEAQRSRLPQMAAALSFRTIFGIIPILALGLVLLYRIATPEDMTLVIRKVIDALGLSAIVVDPNAAQAAIEHGRGGAAGWLVGPPAEMTARTVEELSASAAEARQASAQALEAWITDTVQRVNQINFRAIGMLGVLALIYAALAMMVEIERTFNQVFRVPQGRSWVRRLTNYTTLVVYSPLCLFLTFYIGTQLNTWIDRWTMGSTRLGSGAISLILLGYGVQVSISAMLLLVLYQVIPNTKVRVWPSLAGAFLAALLFEVGKQGFAKYVEFSASASYARLYGSLALIPLFLLWVYFTWFIVLFGLQVAYQLQHGRLRTRAMPLYELGPNLVEPATSLVVMSAVARAFEVGEAKSAPALARDAGVPEPVAMLVLMAMVDRGLVHRLERAGGSPAGEPSFALAKPPASISARTVLEVGFALSGAPTRAPGSPGATTLDRIRSAQLAATDGQSLAEIAGLREGGSMTATPSTQSDLAHSS